MNVGDTISINGINYILSKKKNDNCQGCELQNSHLCTIIGQERIDCIDMGIIFKKKDRKYICIDYKIYDKTYRTNKIYYNDEPLYTNALIQNIIEDILKDNKMTSFSEAITRQLLNKNISIVKIEIINK